MGLHSMLEDYHTSNNTGNALYSYIIEQYLSISTAKVSDTNLTRVKRWTMSMRAEILSRSSVGY